MSKKRKIFTVVGARPQFIKASAISRCLTLDFPNISQYIVHTNQHFDTQMSQVFFDELSMPAPSFTFVRDGNYEAGVGQMIDRLNQLFLHQKPDAVLVYGDTNSTFAAAVASGYCSIPLFHVEAGLRSFNKSMPEERNRIYTDHVSTLLFCPTVTAVENLSKEGIQSVRNGNFTADNPGVFLTGDVMLDTLEHQKNRKHDAILMNIGVGENPFVLLTIHRPKNTDDISRLRSILESMSQLVHEMGLRLVFPIHPRTRKVLELELPDLWQNLISNQGIIMTEPLSHGDLIGLLVSCHFVVTDSGGLQKEAHFLNKPVVILRKETEWTEIVNDGNGILVDADAEKILGVSQWINHGASGKYTPHFGDGQAAQKICNIIQNYFDQKA